VAPGDVIADVAARQNDAWPYGGLTWQVDQSNDDTCPFLVGEKRVPRGPLRGSHVAPHCWWFWCRRVSHVAWFRDFGGRLIRFQTAGGSGTYSPRGSPGLLPYHEPRRYNGITRGVITNCSTGHGSCHRGVPK
jgi:hypothetical protein